MNWRRNFWRWVRRSVDEGALLPRWAIVVRWILFPMDSAYWHLASTRGYNPLRDTWLIDGMEFTGAAMHALVNSHGEVFRITRTGQTVTLERVQTAQPGGGWRPIAEAPKDGSTVLLTDGKYVDAGFYHDGSECYGHRGEAGFFAESDRGSLLTARNFDATHWQPLPAEPSAKGVAP